MNWLLAIIDSIVEFVRRNPLTTIILVMIAVFVPSAFGALLIGLLIIALLILAIPIYGIIKLRRMSRKMEQEARQQGFGGYQSNAHQEFRQRRPANDEGEVKIYATHDANEKRVNEQVGEYVDFEEVKQK